MPARSRREIRVLVVLATAGAAVAFAMFGFALHVVGVNASGVQRADLAGVPRWALRAGSVDPICDAVAVAGIVVAIGAAVLLLAGQRAPRLPGESKRRTIDLLWKCAAWSFAGHALLAFAFTPLAEADESGEVYSESIESIDDPPPSEFLEDYEDDPRYADCRFCSTRSPVLTPVFASIRPEAEAWRPVVAQPHADPFTFEPVVLGTPITGVANERSSITRTMKRRLPRLAECYTRARTEGSGTIVATFTVGWSGGAIDARANGFDPEVAACVETLVRQSHFARSSDGDDFDVRLPIHFRGRAY